MTENSFDIVGFDLDGTLLETSGDVAAAANHAITSIGLTPFAVEDIRRFIGRGAKVLLTGALASAGREDPELVEALLPVFYDHYADHVADHSHVYPGLIAALDEMKAMGIRLAVCTNKIERFTFPLLEYVGISHYFSAIICGDTVGIMKPDPAPLREMIERAGGGRCLFVGDSSNDVRAASAANVPSIAVTFGYPDIPPHNLGANAVIDHYDELLPLIRNWPA